MREEREEQEERSSWWGLIVITSASACWIAFSLWLVGGLGSLLALKPNEIGDTLAGVFSPLAFAWFVYAVFMQKEELSLQREELSMARIEHKGTKEALVETAAYQKIISESTSIQAAFSKKINASSAVLKNVEYLDSFLAAARYIQFYLKGGSYLTISLVKNSGKGEVLRSFFELSEEIMKTNFSVDLIDLKNEDSKEAIRNVYLVRAITESIIAESRSAGENITFDVINRGIFDLNHSVSIKFDSVTRIFDHNWRMNLEKFYQDRVTLRE